MIQILKIENGFIIIVNEIDSHYEASIEGVTKYIKNLLMNEVNNEINKRVE